MILLRPLVIILLLAAPILSLGQSIGGLTARGTGTSIALRPTSLKGAALEDLQFSYSQDAGATWEPIEASCLEFISREAVWNVLECLQVEVFEGSNIQFRASIPTCSPVTFDSYTYEVVQIGSQCWFAENLRNTHYSNGDPIPGGLSNREWVSTESGAMSVYDDNNTYLTTYGRLYNWYAVTDARGLCPCGWHVPTDGEFIALEMGLGMSSLEAISKGWRGTNQGSQLKASHYLPLWNGTNMSGFSALPGGHRSYFGHFKGEGDEAAFWSSSPIGSFVSCWSLYSVSDRVGRLNKYPNFGFSVRCVRD